MPAVVLRSVIKLLNRGIDILELDRHGHLLLDITPDRVDATFVLDRPPVFVAVDPYLSRIDRDRFDNGAALSPGTP